MQETAQKTGRKNMQKRDLDRIVHKLSQLCTSKTEKKRNELPSFRSEENLFVKAPT